jgi:hypothetical protein
MKRNFEQLLIGFIMFTNFFLHPECLSAQNKDSISWLKITFHSQIHIVWLLKVSQYLYLSFF